MKVENNKAQKQGCRRKFTGEKVLKLFTKIVSSRTGTPQNAKTQKNGENGEIGENAGESVCKCNE